MRVAVDAMGGDYTPQEAVVGCASAARDLETEVILVGDMGQIEAILKADCGGIEQPYITIVHASQQVEMDEPGAMAVRRKKDASISVAAKLVKTGEADALVSAGNTGATVAAAWLFLKSVPGIDRPAIACLLPTSKGQIVCLDLGAVVDCQPRHFVDFAIMGSVYAQRVLGCESPRVGLLNIGAEESKGNEVTKAAHRLLRDVDCVNFRGNCEPDEVFFGSFDVAVCDGFAGNILLKTAEGVGALLVGLLRNELRAASLDDSTREAVNEMVRRSLHGVAYEEHGGALLLGVNGVCIIGHGRSSAKAFVNAVNAAKLGIEGNVVGRIAQLAGAIEDEARAVPQA